LTALEVLYLHLVPKGTHPTHQGLTKFYALMKTTIRKEGGDNVSGNFFLSHHI
jgi:hypothetical protein